MTQPAPPKMTKQQAVKLWDSMTAEQKYQFNKMLEQLQAGKLMLKEVNVDDNETIQNIVLDPKETPSAPDTPFYKHFHLGKDD